MAWRFPISRRQQTPVGVELFLWKRRRRTWLILALIAFILAFSWADHRNFFGSVNDDLSRYDGKTFLVVRVVDGDTLDVDVPDPSGKDSLHDKTRIRLWGINAPEMAHHGREIEPFAQEATNFLRACTDHQRVTLTLEPHRVRDVYGRLLAFVSLENGATVNESLVAAGLAHADGRWEHRNLRRFGLIEEQARRDGKGIWAETKKQPFQPRANAAKPAAKSRTGKRSTASAKSPAAAVPNENSQSSTPELVEAGEQAGDD